MLDRLIRMGGLATALWLGLAHAADAAMGAETIMSRVDANKDKQLSLSEVRKAAGDRWDLIKSKNGHVSMLQLGGRIVPSDLKEIGKPSPGVKTEVSKEDYLALAEAFFEKADANRKPGAQPSSGTLDLGELGSPAGKKLIGLLQ